MAVEPNLTVIQAPDAWAAGYEGGSYTVSNIDTGVRYTHEALKLPIAVKKAVATTTTTTGTTPTAAITRHHATITDTVRTPWAPWSVRPPMK